MIVANSLVDGFLVSNAIGKIIVSAQILGSILMVATILGKWRSLAVVYTATRRFLRDFAAGQSVLDYYFQRRPSAVFGIEWIYKETSERLLKLLRPDVRSMLAGRMTDGNGAAAMTTREVELVRGTCEHALEEETARVKSGLLIISTIVSLEPMLGLLGTVWGVLDAFSEMGTAGSANLATIAPSISAALVTTVVGLIVAIPGIVAFGMMNARGKAITSDMEGFADELMGRIACEYQGKGD